MEKLGHDGRGACDSSTSDLHTADTASMGDIFHHQKGQNQGKEEKNGEFEEKNSEKTRYKHKNDVRKMSRKVKLARGAKGKIERKNRNRVEVRE